MVAPDWYFAWVRDYCTAFGVTNEDWINTFRSWRAAMVGLGASGVELSDVTTRCLMESPGPSFPSEHLAAVKRHLGAVKDEKAVKVREAIRADDSAYGVCTYCDNAGLVVVPYLRDVKGGEWQVAYRNHLGEPVYRTCAVTCRCPMGRRSADASAGRDPGLMSLTSYEERVNSAWREHMAEREAAALALVRAHNSADAAGRNLTDRIGTPFGGGR